MSDRKMPERYFKKKTMKTATKKSMKMKEPTKPPPVMQKVILVGESYAGKTSLIHRYMHGEFDTYHPPTVGFVHASVDVKRTAPLRVNYEIWDTAGTERFRSLISMHYRGADVVLLVYDITCEDSFNAIETTWRLELLRHVPEVPVIMVGTKCDLHNKRVVSTERGQQLASKCGYMFFETSSITGYNVEALFWETAFTLARLQRSNHLELSGRTLSVRVRPADDPEPESQSCCVIS